MFSSVSYAKIFICSLSVRLMISSFVIYCLISGIFFRACLIANAYLIIILKLFCVLWRLQCAFKCKEEGIKIVSLFRKHLTCKTYFKYYFLLLINKKQFWKKYFSSFSRTNILKTENLFFYIWVFFCQKRPYILNSSSCLVASFRLFYAYPPNLHCGNCNANLDV